jgi:hypothetical protein
MNEKITVSKGDAKWHTAWKKRIESNTPREGDYNFIIFKGKDGVVYEPPKDGSRPSIFQDGVWVEIPID